MDFQFLSDTILFREIPSDGIQSLLACFGTERKTFPKNSMIFHAGSPIHFIGIVLSGSIHIEHNDLWGNTSILDRIGPGNVFAEIYACMPGEPLMVDVVADEPSEIFFLNTSRLFQVCTPSCPHHQQLIRNLLSITVQKNLNLSRRIFHTSSKTIRGRLLSYLSFQALQHGSSTFSIPFDRQQLADYLSVDRSALSHELSKMQKDGLLTYRKNKFILKDKVHRFH